MNFAICSTSRSSTLLAFWFSHFTTLTTPLPRLLLPLLSSFIVTRPEQTRTATMSTTNSQQALFTTKMSGKRELVGYAHESALRSTLQAPSQAQEEAQLGRDLFDAVAVVPDDGDDVWPADIPRHSLEKGDGLTRAAIKRARDNKGRAHQGFPSTPRKKCGFKPGLKFNDMKAWLNVMPNPDPDLDLSRGPPSPDDKTGWRHYYRSAPYDGMGPRPIEAQRLLMGEEPPKRAPSPLESAEDEEAGMGDKDASLSPPKRMDSMRPGSDPKLLREIADTAEYGDLNNAPSNRTRHRASRRGVVFK